MKPNPSDEQMRVIFLMLLILALTIVRSTVVKQFFKDAFNSAGTSLQGAGTGAQAQPTPQSTLDWHLFIYWGVGAVLLIALADVSPTLVTMFLILVIIEQLLVHWTDYAALLNMPTK